LVCCRFPRLAGARRIIDGYRKLLDEAVAAGELVPCDTSLLAVPWMLWRVVR
jgi:hypothetical protein